MNILVPDSWLKDYIKTNASPQEMADALSLRAFSVEKIEDLPGGDKNYEIEVTTNRGDALSVLGVARELRAILPRAGFSAEWREPKKFNGGEAAGQRQLKVEIKDRSLVPRFCAIVLGGVEIKPSPESMQRRLEAAGTRALNNVIDITNYLMFDKGQPMHAFDYDKIKGQKMVVRESKKGEKIITLDGTERVLPAGVIVIEDGDGRLIDLCGIMGAKNSEVDEQTKNVLLFVQVYDPVRIRQASMALGHRTEAAMRFEKGIDPEGVLPALWEAVAMMKEYAGAQVVSEPIDILNADYRPKSVEIDYEKISAMAGIEIDKSLADKTLTDLGFKIEGDRAQVPSWRYDDINIAEDLAEEVIRLYGYQKLPDNLLTGQIPLAAEDRIFYWEDKAKDYLRLQGFFECYTNSATSHDKAGEEAMALANALSEEFAYLKTSLLPQLEAVLQKNQGYGESLKVFELANAYLKDGRNLPRQPIRLGLMVKNVDFVIFKGAVEGLFKELGVAKAPKFEILDLGRGILAAELDFEALAKQASRDKVYTPLCAFNAIKENLTFVVPESATYPEMNKLILAVDRRISKLSFKGIYQNCLTLAIEYLDRDKQISSAET
ncbi:MAG: phenylalanine--tRNA ligase subunit beta, partial [Candidatus Portnoybacteria bacterium]|nr:phenylalanine--tRNA ligase subunit beta [Candidatus Portnoybacteria bacterium]